MITSEKLNEIKNKYGKVASFAIWKHKEENEKSNIDDLSIIQHDKLNSKFIIVGLNVSNKIIIDFSNFHSNSKYANDYKLRYALSNTPLWGCYMTDLIKNYEEKKSNCLIKYLKENKEILLKNILLFEEEINFIGSQNPIIIACGTKCYNILHKYMKNTYKIYKTTHYSAYITKEKLKYEIEQILNEIK